MTTSTRTPAPTKSENLLETLDRVAHYADGQVDVDMVRDILAATPKAVLVQYATEYVRAELADRARRRTLAAERAAAEERDRKRLEEEAAPERVAARRSAVLADMDESARISRSFWDAMGGALDRLREGIRMEWTEELLASTFTLSGGRAVSWGEASLEDHEARLGMFKANARANLEGMVRHEQAIEAIREAGAGTLNEAVKVAA